MVRVTNDNSARRLGKLMPLGNVISNKELTIYCTMPTYNDPRIEAFWKHCGKAENAGNQHFPLFPTIFSTQSNDNSTIWASLKLSSANSINLDNARILLSGKGLRKISYRVSSSSWKVFLIWRTINMKLYSAFCPHVWPGSCWLQWRNRSRRMLQYSASVNEMTLKQDQVLPSSLIFIHIIFSAV